MFSEPDSRVTKGTVTIVRQREGGKRLRWRVTELSVARMVGRPVPGGSLVSRDMTCASNRKEGSVQATVENTQPAGVGPTELLPSVAEMGSQLPTRSRPPFSPQKLRAWTRGSKKLPSGFKHP